MEISSQAKSLEESYRVPKGRQMLAAGEAQRNPWASRE